MLRRPLLSTLFPYTTLFRSFHWDGIQLLPQTYFDQYIKNQVPMGITIPPEGSLTPNDYLNANDGELQVTGYQVGDRKSTRLNQSRENLVCRLLLEKKKIKK